MVQSVSSEGTGCLRSLILGIANGCVDQRQEIALAAELLPLHQERE